MSQWTPENIIVFFTALAGVMTAVFAGVHSIKTRSRLNDHFENDHIEQDANVTGTSKTQ